MLLKSHYLVEGESTFIYILPDPLPPLPPRHIHPIWLLQSASTTISQTEPSLAASSSQAGPPASPLQLLESLQLHKLWLYLLPPLLPNHPHPIQRLELTLHLVLNEEPE